MIVLYNAIFGYIGTVVFQLISERIAIATKSSEAVYEGAKDMLAFSYLAIPTRHEVPVKPAEEKII